MNLAKSYIERVGGNVIGRRLSIYTSRGNSFHITLRVFGDGKVQEYGGYEGFGFWELVADVFGVDRNFDIGKERGFKFLP